MAELRASAPSWYPTFPYTRSRGFSLENLGRDFSEWRADRALAADEARQDRALRAIQAAQSDEVRRHAPFVQSAAQDNPGRAVAELIQEADSVAKPSLDPVLPGVDPFRRLKSPERMLADTRRGRFLQGMLNRFGYPEQKYLHPKTWDVIDRAYENPEQAAKVKSAMMRYATDADGYRSDNQSSREWAGVLGPGSALGSAMTVMQSPAAMLYAAGEMTAGSVDPDGAPEKDAGKRFMHALNTISAPGQQLAAAIGYGQPAAEGHSVWSEQDRIVREFDKAIQWQDLSPEVARAFRDQMAMKGDQQMLGREYFRNRGLGPTSAALLGGLTDDLFNPFLDTRGLTAGIGARDAFPFLVEFGPGLAINSAEGAATMLERLKKIGKP